MKDFPTADLNQREQIEALNRIVEIQQQISTSTLSLRELLFFVCEKVQVLTAAPCVVIEMVEGDKLYYKAGVGFAFSPDIHLKIGSSLSGASVLTGQVLYSEDTAQDPRVDREACLRVGARSMVCVPLKNQRMTVGVLKIFSPEVSAFGERDIQILRIIAGVLCARIGQAAEAEQKRLALESLQQTEKRLRQSEVEAREANRLKSEFLANTSHEIRTPINGIMGMASVLLDGNLPDQEKQYIQMIANAAENLMGIINDILDFSKIEADMLGLELIPFNTSKIVADVRQLLELPAAEKGISVITSVSAEVPPCLKGDPTRIHQILVNLGNNAVKFTSSGQVRIRALWDESTPSPSLRFEVEDTGLGIPAEARKRIFQPFIQADASTTRRFGGTGLGLSISKRLIDMMNGEIGFDSVEGLGTTFWFRLPVQIIDGKGHLNVDTETPDTRPQRALKVLLVEDNLVNQMVALKMLEKMGHHVSKVSNGLEALHALTLGKYDVILMDCHMPVMDGYEATQTIRRLPDFSSSQTPIIAMTANALATDRQKCLAVGMNNYIAKPVHFEELHAVIEHTVHNKP